MAPFDTEGCSAASSKGASETNPRSSTNSPAINNPNKENEKGSTGCAPKPETGSASTNPANKATNTTLPPTNSSKGTNNEHKNTPATVAKGKNPANKEDKSIPEAGVKQDTPSTSSNNTQAQNTIATTKTEPSTHPSTQAYNTEENERHNSLNTNDTQKLTQGTGSKEIKPGCETKQNADFKSFDASNGKSIYVLEADICTLKTDVIVCPSTKKLNSSKGAAKAIREAAGEKIAEACKQEIKKKGPMQVGKCFVTKGFNLPAKCVVHAAGPVWSGDEKDTKCKDDMKKTIMECLKVANTYGTSVAMPPIGAGSSGFPLNLVAELVAQSVNQYCVKNKGSHLKNIIIVDINKSLLDKVSSNLSEKSTDVKITEFSQERFQELFILNGGGFFHDTPMKNSSQILESQKKSAVQNTKASRAVKDTISAKATKPEGTTTYSDKHGKDQASGVTKDTNSSPPIQAPRPACPENGTVQETPQQTTSHAPGIQPPDARAAEISEIPQGAGVRRDDGVASKISSGVGDAIEVESTTTPIDPSSKSQSGESSYEDNEPTKKKTIKRTRKLFKHDLLTPVADPDGQCIICVDIFEIPVSLPCGHVFCKECIDTWLETKKSCPCCGTTFGVAKGNQPDGTMDVKTLSSKLPGHPKSKGTIEITYHFLDGIQSDVHPKPGHDYKGTTRTAYLPDSPEGRGVLALLRKAFDARLLFTIGRSVTTGREDRVTWNDVHHKTKKEGGASRFGYPDPGYLSRVKEELASKGIQEETKTPTRN